MMEWFLDFVCWMVGHVQPPKLTFDEHGNMVLCCGRCGKLADEIRRGA